MVIGPINTGLVGAAGGVKSVERKARSGKDVKSPAARRIDDVSSIMDIPEAELTPKVRAAIMSLMEEVERLREELKRNHSRVERLEQLADQDTLAPIANRRAFVKAKSERRKTVPEDITLTGRRKIWFAITEKLMAEFNAEMERNIQRYMTEFAL